MPNWKMTLNAVWEQQREQNEVIKQIKGLPITKSKDRKRLVNEIGIIEDCGDA